LVTNLNNDVVLGSSTYTGGLTVGTLAGRNISVASATIHSGGSLTLNSGGWIDIVGNANITGNLTLNATGNIASASTLTSAGVSFGSLYALGTANSTSAVGGISDSSGTVTSISSSNLPMLSYSTGPTITVTTQAGARRARPPRRRRLI